MSIADRLLEAEAVLCGNYQLTRCEDPHSSWEALQRAERIFRAHGRSEQAARCQVASSRALYDTGRERQALAYARAALQEPALPAWDRACSYALLFQATGRMGRLAEAYGHLNDQALPLARAIGEPNLLAHLLGLKAWFFARLIHSAQNAKLPLPSLIDMPSFGPRLPGWGEVKSLFEEAHALLPEATIVRSLHIDHQYALGLSRERGAHGEAAAQLARLAQLAEADDPTTAAWGYFCQAMVLHDAGDLAGALSALPAAMALAQRCRLDTMTRDLLYFQSLCHEASGHTDAAFAALKGYVAMTLHSLAPEQPPSFGLPDAVHSALPGTAMSMPLHRLRQAEPASVKQALRVIEQGLGDALTAESVAAACGLSRRTLDGAFHAAKGVTLAAYLKRKQFEFASDQLLHTRRPVREIALAIGYRSPTMFAREFRQRLGLMPSQWREMVEGGLRPAHDR